MVKKNRAVPNVGFVSGSVAETRIFGEHLGRTLQPGDVVALSGELGSGKTTLIQGIAQGLGRDPEGIKSPTFVLVRDYPGEVPLVHVDAYRLDGSPAVAWLDLDLIFSPRKITVIEWAERFGELLPQEHLALRLEHVSINRRRMTVEGHGTRGGALLAQLRAVTERLREAPAAAPEPGPA